MHRSGDQMLKVLGELSGRLNNVPLLTVLVGRSDPGEWLAAFPAATTVRLGPLSRPDAVALAGGFACDKPLATEAADFLVDRAGGNPLYLRELVSMARAQGLLVDDGDCYRLTRAGHHPGHPAGPPGGPTRRPRARAEACPPARRGHGGRHRRRSAGLGVAERPGARCRPWSRTASCATPRRVATTRWTRCCARSPTRRCLATSAASSTAGPPSFVVGSEERARHLDRAAGYLPEDRAVVAEAAEALARAGQELFAAARHLDALRLLERAVALGCRRSSALLDLAKVQSLCRKPEDVFETLAMVDRRPRRPHRRHRAGPHRRQRQGVHRPGRGPAPTSRR